MPVRSGLYVRVSRQLCNEKLAGLRNRFVIELCLIPKQDLGPGCVPLRLEKDPELLPGPPGHWYDANLLTPYYAPGYERGNLPLILQCAEWLEAMLPDGEVWYGNGDDIEGLQPFGPIVRSELRTYYEQVGRLPYQRRMKDRLGILARIVSFWRGITSPRAVAGQDRSEC